jgi:UDPglucose--hexose-1-phosphate uridylyltransferase
VSARRRQIVLPDGRYLIFYAFDDLPFPDTIAGAGAPPAMERLKGPQLRWHPLLGEWVAVATHRQERTFLPPADFCPLCPTRGGFVTEVPAVNYDLVVFENRFPSLERDAPPVQPTESALFQAQPARGACEVVLYTPDHHTSLADAPLERLRHLVEVWTDRYRELSARKEVRYVYIFENKGVAMGVTLHHPHGQIYAYPFVPPQAAREEERSRAHWQSTGRCLLCDVLAEELHDGRRMVAENDHFAAVVPFFARWPYETHVTSRRHCSDLGQLSADEQEGLADVLRRVLRGFDRLFGTPFPYVMALHQRAIAGGGAHPYSHLHVEFYPPMRSAQRMKYLAGSELGVGTFINDTFAEEKAAELRARCEAARNDEG